MISPEVLRRLPFFASLDAAAYKKLAMIGEEVSVPAGRQLFYENKPADAFYVILSGSVTLSIDLDQEGHQRDELCIIREGEMVGWSALVEPYTYTLNALTTADTTLVKIKSEGMRALMDDDPTVGYILMKHLAKAMGVRLTNLRIECVSKIRSQNRQVSMNEG